MDRLKINVLFLVKMIFPYLFVITLIFITLFTFPARLEKIFLDSLMILIPTYILVVIAIISGEKSEGMGVIFSADTLIIRGPRNKKVFAFKKHEIVNTSTMWNELSAKSKDYFFYKWITITNVNTGQKIISFPLGWYTEDTFFPLTKKYVPIDHEFYKIVKDYAQKKKYDF